MKDSSKNPYYALELLSREYDIKYNKKDLEKTNCLYLLEQMNGRGKKNDWYGGKSKNSAMCRLYSHLHDKKDSVRQNMELNNTKRIRLHIVDYNIAPNELAQKEYQLIDKMFVEDRKRTINRDFRHCLKSLENLKKQGFTKATHDKRIGIVQYKEMAS